VVGRDPQGVTALLALLALAGAGCAAGPGSGSSTTSLPAAAAAVAPAPGLEGAAMPFHIVRTRPFARLTLEQLGAALERARAVCLGESHPNPHHHWAQLRVLDEVSRRARARGADVAVGMEMFERPYQGVLDDYLAGRSSINGLIVRSEWSDRWGFDFDLYRPLVTLAQERKLALLALNAERELVKQVARRGLQTLSPQARGSLPALEVNDRKHRAYFDEATAGHGVPGKSFDNFYLAQVIRDEMMADRAVRWLNASPAAVRGHVPRQVVVIAGQGHCHDSAIPGRIRRRGATPSVSVLPVFDRADLRERVARGELADQDYLFVLGSDGSAAQVGPQHGKGPGADEPARTDPDAEPEPDRGELR
jgi:uncharacterized iron-regulated protein